MTNKISLFSVFFFSGCWQDVCLTDGEQSGNEDPDITDEHAQLLHSGIILKPHKTIGTSKGRLPLYIYIYFLIQFACMIIKKKQNFILSFSDILV